MKRVIDNVTRKSIVDSNFIFCDNPGWSHRERNEKKLEAAMLCLPINQPNICYILHAHEKRTQQQGNHSDKNRLGTHSLWSVVWQRNLVCTTVVQLNE